MMETAAITLLLEAAGVAALVSDRVWPVAIPQGAAYPNIVVTRIDGAPEYAADGEVGLQNGRLQIDCRATTHGEAMRVRDQVFLTLSAYVGTVTGGIDVRLIRVVYERDERAAGTGEPAYVFRRQMDVDVWLAD